MSFWDKFFSKGPSAPQIDPVAVQETKPEPIAYHNDVPVARYFTVNFDGEKNLGEMGPALKYKFDFDTLSVRGWQMFFESPICQILLKRFVRWVISSGLRMQAQPLEDVLRSEGIELSKDAIRDFKRIAETRFKAFMDSNMGDFTNMESLHRKGRGGLLTAITGGDALVIRRYDAKGQLVKVEIKDGCDIQSPGNLKYLKDCYRNEYGNRVKHGVEIDDKGEHVAFYLKSTKGTYERILAKGPKTGRVMASMWYAGKDRMDEVRGKPLHMVIMEYLKKFDRYQDATLATAEERAKLTLVVEHEDFSTGADPFKGNSARANGVAETGDVPKTIQGEDLARKVAATTNKQVVNMPKGSKLTTVESDAELKFKEYFGVNIEIMCAVIGIPPNVAMGKYDDSFSASRAALKDWEHTLFDERKSVAEQYYQPIYNLWLDTQVLLGKIPAPGYNKALQENNQMALQAYRSARFGGPSVPHIDPVKEVKAIREKLGPRFDKVPLMNLESAVDAFNEGDYSSILIQCSEELKEADDLMPDDPEDNLDE